MKEIKGPRSVYNKFENVMTFLKAQKVRDLIGKNDWPRYVEEEPEIYEKEDLEKFFAAWDEEERIWFEFFLPLLEEDQSRRLTREGLRKTIHYLQVLDDAGVTFRSFTEQYLDTCGIFRDVVIGLMATLAQQERIRISERTKAGLARVRRQGRKLGRPRLKDLSEASRSTIWRRKKAAASS